MERFYGRGTAAMGGGATEEFQEEDVWGMNVVVGSTENSQTRNVSSLYPPPPPQRFSVTTSRAIPVRWSIAPERHSSAPVDIPDWSKILKQQRRVRDLCEDACEDGGNGNGNGNGKGWLYHERYREGDDDNDDEDDGDGDGMMIIPPHEYLARRNSEKNASLSMCEGLGRTRELHKLRNAVLTKTGFIE